MLKLGINICTPINASQVWGDTFFAQNLARELLNCGVESVINFYEEWNNSNYIFDATLTITGKGQFTVTNKNIPNFCWIISHPECRTIDELEQFDHTWIASELFTKLVSSDIRSVSYLPQCTNFDIEKSQEEEIDVLFIGNNYYDNFSLRKSVEDFLKTGIDCNFKVIGKDWEKGLDSKYILAEFVAVDKLASYYQRARIVLNDHHALMKKYGFINNRVFDLAKLKVFQISDEVDGLNNLGVITYKEPDDLNVKVEQALNSDTFRRRNSEICYRLMNSFTFKQRAKIISEKIIEMI
jgi:hypothetical protein